MFSHSFDAAYVQPIAKAENQFLQVLVDRFRIRRVGNGFEMRVAFNDESPSIWLREAKRHILSTLPTKRRGALQRDIDAFFASNDEVYDYHDSSFPFRLGNGGTLPVVRLKGTDYYCLFFRDSHPTGWNIANGGANTRHDLLYPDAIVERELREELIIVEPEQGRWYVFDRHDARLRDHPDCSRAHELWSEHFRRQGFPEFQDIPLPLKWSLPPDADQREVEQRRHDSMRIQFSDDMLNCVGQGFLSINAEDFGIEFDRIAKLSVGPDAIFCDGELRGHRLLNRVVGLFRVSRMHELLAQGARCFHPDRIFWDGEDRTGDDLRNVIEQSLRRRGSSWAQLDEALQEYAAPNAPGDPFDLCPVTRTIIGRHRQLHAAEQVPPDLSTGAGQFDIFVSFATEDRVLAQRVFDELTNTADWRGFFSDITMTAGGFDDQIDRALDSARSFVAVATRIEHLHKSWVEYEWRTFHNDLNSGRKPTNSPFLAFVSGIDPQDLPRPLRTQQAVTADPSDPTPALTRLKQYIARAI